MISETIQFLEKELNAYFKQHLNIEENMAIASPLVNADGTAILLENKIAITLVNLEEEAMLKTTVGYSSQKITPPNSINLHVLFSVKNAATHYIESLRRVSETIDFFRSNTVFRIETYPQLPGNIEKITAEMVNLDTHSRNSLWTSLGSSYMPSVLYKMRILGVPAS